jgi:hypothetical protein
VLLQEPNIIKFDSNAIRSKDLGMTYTVPYYQIDQFGNYEQGDLSVKIYKEESPDSENE